MPNFAVKESQGSGKPKATDLKVADRRFWDIVPEELQSAERQAFLRTASESKHNFVKRFAPIFSLFALKIYQKSVIFAQLNEMTGSQHISKQTIPANSTTPVINLMEHYLSSYFTKG